MTYLRALAIGAASLVFAGAAQPAPITYDVEADLTAGQSISGQFDYDADTGEFSAIDITSTFGANYQFNRPDGPQVPPQADDVFAFLTTEVVEIGVTQIALFELLGTLPGPGGRVDIRPSFVAVGPPLGGDTAFGTCGTADCTGFTGDGFGAFSGTITAEGAASEVPLPAAGWLLLAGIAGLGAVRMRRRAA
ncbi:MAG: VPLPA-CTERM sorting domain-containing protein [Pseudomonadota bacterium]